MRYPTTKSVRYSDELAASENSEASGIAIGKWKGFATFICVRCGYSSTHRFNTEVHKCCKAPKPSSVLRALQAKLFDADGRQITHIEEKE